MRLPPDAGQLAPLRRSLADWLAHAEVEPNASAALVLATHEAAANAIEHAQAEVVVAVSRDRGRMTVVVRSAGGWKESDEDEYRGRGLILMARLDVAGRGRIASGRISRPDAAVALTLTPVTDHPYRLLAVVSTRQHALDADDLQRPLDDRRCAELEDQGLVFSLHGTSGIKEDMDDTGVDEGRVAQVKDHVLPIGECAINLIAKGGDVRDVELTLQANGHDLIPLGDDANGSRLMLGADA